MQRIPNVDAATATGAANDLLTEIRTKMGKLPNMMKIMVHAPAAVEANLAVGGALTRSAASCQAHRLTPSPRRSGRTRHSRRSSD